MGPEDPSNRKKEPNIPFWPIFRKLQDDSKNVSLKISPSFSGYYRQGGSCYLRPLHIHNEKLIFSSSTLPLLAFLGTTKHYSLPTSLSLPPSLKMCTQRGANDLFNLSSSVINDHRETKEMSCMVHHF